MSVLPTSGPIPIGRREIIALMIVIKHNIEQYKAAKDASPEQLASLLVSPTSGLLFDERTGAGGLNDYFNEHPGISSSIKWPNQIKRTLDSLNYAGLMDRNGRILIPTKAGIDFANAIIQRYSSTPYDWPEQVLVDAGKPDWANAKMSNSAYAE